jgi:hypothetical protein
MKRRFALIGNRHTMRKCPVKLVYEDVNNVKATISQIEAASF